MLGGGRPSRNPSQQGLLCSAHTHISWWRQQILKSQDGHGTSPFSPKHPACSHRLPQKRELEARMSPWGHTEPKGPVLEAGQGPGEGE